MATIRRCCRSMAWIDVPYHSGKSAVPPAVYAVLLTLRVRVGKKGLYPVTRPHAEREEYGGPKRPPDDNGAN